MQKCINYITLDIWIANCENYLKNNIVDYLDKELKVVWIALRFINKRRNQWRKHSRKMLDKHEVII